MGSLQSFVPIVRPNQSEFFPVMYPISIGISHTDVIREYSRPSEILKMSIIHILIIVCRGTVEIVIQEDLWSIRGYY